jgi:MoxR-like ATPase
MDAIPALVRHVRSQLDRVIVGQNDLKMQCLAVLLCRGHALLEGVPGVAKTLTVKAFSRILGLGFRRVQCTPDLMPADIVGTSVASLSTGTFSLHRGPAFTDVLLVDEINRMPPRTQAALLECMEERQITIDGDLHALSPLFTVFATQNPIEFEGTYPLPEAQLDRFLAKISVPYPSEAEETELVKRAHQGFDAARLDAVELEGIPSGLLEHAETEFAGVTVQGSLIGYIVEIIRRTRDWPALSLGASPRAAVNLLKMSKAVAVVEGRDYVIPDDVKTALLPVLRHRVAVRPETDLEGVTADQVLGDVARAVAVPK